MKETLVRSHALWPVAWRAALLTVFAIVVAVSIGCDSNQDDNCTNGAWRCDPSRKEIQQCVDQDWKFVEMCVAPTICREGPGFDCHGTSTACCELTN